MLDLILNADPLLIVSYFVIGGLLTACVWEDVGPVGAIVGGLFWPLVFIIRVWIKLLD